MKAMLVFLGVAMLGAVVGLVMPWGMMVDIARVLGFDSLPYHPVVEYLARSLSGIYLMLGVVTLGLVRCVPDRLGPVRVLFGTLLGYGVVSGIINWWIQMPGWLVIGEMVSLIPVGLLGLWLCRRLRK